MTPWNATISLFSRVSDSTPRKVQLQGARVFSVFRTEHVSDVSDSTKKDGPLFSPVVYFPGKGREKKQSAKNIEAVTMLVFDWDAKQKATIPQVEAVLKGNDIEHVVYTTYSHQPEAHAFRAVIPLTQPVSVSVFSKLWSHFNKLFQSYNVAPDPSGSNVDRVYYLPTCRVIPGTNPDEYKYYSYWPSPEGVYDPSFLAPSSETVSAEPGEKKSLTGAEVLAQLRALRPAKEAVQAPSPLESVFSDQVLREVGYDNYTRVSDSCAFIRYAELNSSALTEPEWYAQISIAARCESGEELVHELSSAYPGYDRDETENKRMRALTDTGPYTCVKIATLSPEAAKACAGCAFNGKVTSPIQLGAPDKEDPNTTPDQIREYEQAKNKAALFRAERLLTEARAKKSEAQKKLSEAKSKRRIMKSAATSMEQLVTIDAEVESASQAVRDATETVKAAETVLRQATRTAKTAEMFSDADPLTFDRLQKTPQGSVESRRMLNAFTIFESDPVFKNLNYNIFSDRAYTGGEEITPETVTRLRLDMQRRYGVDVSVPDFRSALILACRKAESHPVRDWLRSLRWDGVSRLADLLPKGFGAQPPSDVPNADEYLKAAGTKFAISAVARVLEHRDETPTHPQGGPGCKVDTLLILVGKQGRRKSTAFRALVPDSEWFSDSNADLHGKDIYQQIAGVWLYEFSELDSFKKAESSRIKAFTSSQVDNFRPPYAENTIKRKRQTVIVGSTNEDEFIVDPTGDRRYVPVRIGACDVHWLKTNASQIWAEAVHLYDAGEIWWFTPEEERIRSEVASDFREESPIQEKLRDYLRSTKVSGRGFVTVSDILSDLFALPLSMMTDPRYKRDVTNALKRLGLEPSAVFDKNLGRKVRGYLVSPEAFPPYFTPTPDNVSLMPPILGSN